MGRRDRLSIGIAAVNELLTERIGMQLDERACDRLEYIAMRDQLGWDMAVRGLFKVAHRATDQKHRLDNPSSWLVRALDDMLEDYEARPSSDRPDDLSWTLKDYDFYERVDGPASQPRPLAFYTPSSTVLEARERAASSQGW